MINKFRLRKFENEIVRLYENKKIKSPIHLSGNNEDNLIKIFKKIKKNDWVFSSWRNHYHALLHGISEKNLKKQIIKGKSMSVCSNKPKFYSSSIVAGGLSIALGLAMAAKRKKNKNKVWVFVGDMTFETGVFHEVFKYSKNFKLPLKFIIEDNGLSTNTPTKKAWNKQSKIPKEVIYYKYKRVYPHHGSGDWILF